MQIPWLCFEPSFIRSTIHTPLFQKHLFSLCCRDSFTFVTLITDRGIQGYDCASCRCIQVFNTGLFLTICFLNILFWISSPYVVFFLSDLCGLQLEYDILEYVVIERLVQGGREKLKDDGLNLSDWLQSLASFWGHLYVTFSPFIYWPFI